MATRKFAQMVLAALVGLGFFTGTMRADDEKTGGTTLPAPKAVAPVGQPAVVIGQTEEPGTSDSVSTESQPRGFKQCVKDYFQKHGWCCWSSHNSFTCGTLKSECVFIFGSCREFFGEPCLKGPPAPGDLAVTGNGNSKPCRYCAP